MNEPERDTIIQNCVSEVRLPHFIRREIYNMLVEAIFFFKFQVGPTFGRKMMTGVKIFAPCESGQSCETKGRYRT